MLFHNKKVQVSTIMDIDVSKNYWCSAAKLIELHGTGALQNVTMELSNDYYGYTYLSHFKLNGIPLIQKDSPSCPTCASLLATGYGVDTIDSPEIISIRDSINKPFNNLKQSISDIVPLLGLLQSGLYVIADVEVYPTDGNGHFFWDTNNTFTENPATSGVLTEEYNYIEGFPAYLYPTQNTNCFDESRVEHYLKMFDDCENEPRAIIYNYSEFVSIILDGHHKACAAAKLNKKVKCLAILPYGGIMYKIKGKQNIPDKICFSGIDIDFDNIPNKYQKKYKNNRVQFTKVDKLETNLINKTWDECYLKSANQYPKVDELAEIVAYQAEFQSISDQEIEMMFIHIDENNINKLRGLLLLLSFKQDKRVKSYAIRCTRISSYKLKVTAFEILNRIKNDNDIEEVFINYLVEDNDKHSYLRMIASNYWD